MMANSKEYYREYRNKNREKIRLKQREWYLLNRDKAKKASIKYEKSEKGKKKLAVRSKTKKYKLEALLRAHKYKNADPDRYRKIQRRYQASRRLLGGKIAQKSSLVYFYDNCPENMEVDHIIPINHNLICGLHVPWNMQYLTRAQNACKSNSFDLTYENVSWKKKG